VVSLRIAFEYQGTAMTCLQGGDEDASWQCAPTEVSAHKTISLPDLMQTLIQMISHGLLFEWRYEKEKKTKGSEHCLQVTHVVCGNEGTVGWASPSYSVSEGNGFIEVTIVRTGGGVGAFEVALCCRLFPAAKVKGITCARR